jgi:flagellar basal-body rod protein FlgG
MELAFQVSQNGIAHSVFKQSTIANNLSNMTTTAYKAKRAESGTFRIPGTQTAATTRKADQGDLKNTNRDLDVAIQGEGFFILESDTVLSFTRAGNFRVDEERNIVTPGGTFLEADIVIPEESTRVVIHPNGTVAARYDDGTLEILGQLEIARFQNPAGLIPIGDNVYLAGPDSGDPRVLEPGDEGAGVLRQHFLENSNVDEAREITNQLINQRQFQMNLKTFQIMNDLVGRAVDISK